MCVFDLTKSILRRLHSDSPQFTDSAPAYVIEGDSLFFTCNVTSFPQSKVSLSFGGNPIGIPYYYYHYYYYYYYSYYYRNYYYFTSGSFIHIFYYYFTAMHPSDEGNYTCSATITHGQPAVTEVFSDTVFIAVYGESCTQAH